MTISLWVTDEFVDISSYVIDCDSIPIVSRSLDQNLCVQPLQISITENIDHDFEVDDKIEINFTTFILSYFVSKKLYNWRNSCWDVTLESTLKKATSSLVWFFFYTDDEPKNDHIGSWFNASVYYVMQCLIAKIYADEDPTHLTADSAVLNKVVHTYGGVDYRFQDVAMDVNMLGLIDLTYFELLSKLCGIFNLNIIYLGEDVWELVSIPASITAPNDNNILDYKDGEVDDTENQGYKLLINTKARADYYSYSGSVVNQVTYGTGANILDWPDHLIFLLRDPTDSSVIVTGSSGYWADNLYQYLHQTLAVNMIAASAYNYTEKEMEVSSVVALANMYAFSDVKYKVENRSYLVKAKVNL